MYDKCTLHTSQPACRGSRELTLFKGPSPSCMCLLTRVTPAVNTLLRAPASVCLYGKYTTDSVLVFKLDLANYLKRKDLQSSREKVGNWDKLNSSSREPAWTRRAEWPPSVQ